MDSDIENQHLIQLVEDQELYDLCEEIEQDNFKTLLQTGAGTRDIDVRKRSATSVSAGSKKRKLSEVNSSQNPAASSTSPGSEKHARYQQKQMQEREQKIASLYEAQQARALERVRRSPSDSRDSRASPPQPPPPAHPGKVRQMFEERRTKGIDKSYPLQPIQNTDRTRKPLPNGFAKVSSMRVVEKGSKGHTRVENGSKGHTRVENGTKVSTRVENGKTSSQAAEKRTSKTSHSISWHSVKKQQTKSETVVNRSGDLNHNHQPDLNAVKEALLQGGELVPPLEGAAGQYRLEDETFPEALAPAATPRSPERPARPPRRSPAKAGPAQSKPAPAPAAPPRRATSDNTVSESKKAPGAMHRTANPAPIPRRYPAGVANRRTASSSGSSGAGAGAGTGAGAACGVCGRSFAPDRLATHQDICRRAHNKKRKPFDALKHRLAGTEAEPFIGKLRKGANSAGKPRALNSNWRQKHDEFIQAIRAAKQVQQHLAAGGKLSDLPPPPPSENPDYVACPHCGRRFNQGAADRHIPKCANFQFNKPKPAASRRR